MKDEQEMIRLKNQRLEKLAQEIGQEAQERGLTPEILSAFLNNEESTAARVQDFQSFCDEVGRKAAARGMTEEKLTEILSEDE